MPRPRADESTRPSIVVLTGAGISVESGLPSFRGAGGLWQGRRLEEVATPEAFARDPLTVQRFYDHRVGVSCFRPRLSPMRRIGRSLSSSAAGLARSSS
jgi:NAD-dependent deacetylase